jgi:large subunit ribosomal protein L10
LQQEEQHTMSKVIKQLQMDAIRKSFEGVRDLVVVSIKGLDCHADHALRANLRKKEVRIQVMKNSLARRVFTDIGLNVPTHSPFWTGPTAFVWGASSIAEVSKALDGELKSPKTGAQFKDKVVIKGAVADGRPLPFEQALKMPTRTEAIARVISLALAPASRLVSQLRGPGSSLASQIKTLSEKKPAEGDATPAVASTA